MRRMLRAGLMSMLITTLGVAAEPIALKWNSPALPNLPDAEGFAGMYAGRSGGVLLAAGGANFPDAKPWEGGKKAWCDAIFVFDPQQHAWRRAAQALPRALGYGASVSYDGALYCMGGSDGVEHRRETFALRHCAGKIERQDLPPLPAPVAEMACVRCGSTVYLLGGLAHPTATRALSSFYALDLASAPEGRAWRELPTWPGPARMQAAAATYDGAVYLLGGLELTADADGRPLRKTPFLRDAYRYTPGAQGAEGGWEKLADLPRPTAASPQPSLATDDGKVVLLGGIDGMATAPPQDRPPFDRRLQIYDVAADAWTVMENGLPEGASRVTAPTAEWDDGWVIVSGERLPGRRSARVDFVRAE